MKIIIMAAFALLSTSVFAQNAPIKNQYSIEIIKPDSIFLLEKIFKEVKESPRPQETTTATLYRSENEIADLVKRLREQSENFAYVAQQIENELAKKKATAKK